MATLKVSIEDLISELAANSDQAIINPKTKERLKAQGVQFNESQPLSLEEKITNSFEKRKELALELAKRLPDPPIIASPAIESLYDEIREAIIFGLNGAAITLSGILVEFILKYSTYKIEMGGYAKYDPEKWDEFENFTFAPAIKRAEKVGLLDAEQVSKLESFKNNYRNPYNHYNIKRITQSIIIEDVTRLNVITHEVEVLDVAPKDNPIFQPLAKRFIDAESVFDVFEFADNAVRFLLNKVNELLSDAEEQRIDEATKRIFERRKSVYEELAKGAK